MEELLAEVLVPDIVVGVQLHEGERTVDGSSARSSREEHRVVAAQAEGDYAGSCDLGEGR